jgi:hypothetical protein
MKRIIERKIFIKDINTSRIGGSVIIFSSLMTILINIKLNISTVVTIEQALFVILSAVIVVFNESILGYKNISRLKNEINRLKKYEIKERIKVLSSKDNDVLEMYYEEYLNKLSGFLEKFKSEVLKFRRRSYKLYLIFTFLGIIIILITLISSKCLLANILLDKLEWNWTILVKKYSLFFFLYAQITLIPVWIYSAFQAEKQKNDIFKYLDVYHIAKNLDGYINDKTTEEINMNK